MNDSDSAGLLYDPGDDEDTLVHVVRPTKAAEQPSPSTRYLLLSLTGAELGRVVSIDDTRLIVGRGAECHIVLRDSEASRQHARILLVASMAILEDLASLNGTFVNGKRVVRQALNNGDVVQFGAESLFRFTVTDTTEEAVLRQLYESSVLDPLTGARRRAEVDLRLAEEVSFVRRHNVSVSVLILEIDGFAELSRRLGKAVGNQVLAVVSAAISSSLRDGDLFGRYSGQQFATILPKTDLQQARAVAGIIQRAVETIGIEHKDETVRVTVSIGGAAQACCEPLTAPRLLDVAEKRLALARESGKNGMNLDNSTIQQDARLGSG